MEDTSSARAPDLFSIVLVSTALSLFYAAHLKGFGQPRSLPRMIRSFVRTPRELPLKEIDPVRGFGYVHKLDLDTTDSNTGIPPFRILENGRLLPRRDVDSTSEVCEKGRGRSVYLNGLFAFAPSDNADLRVTPRNYRLLETLTDNPAKIRALAEVNGMRDRLGNDGLWLLTKLRIHCDPRLTFGRVAVGSRRDMVVHDIRFDLDQIRFGLLRAEEARVRWTDDGLWRSLEIDLETLTAPWLPEPGRLVLALDWNADGELRLRGLQLSAGASLWIGASLAWSDTELGEATVTFGEGMQLREGLWRACGGQDAWEAWIGGFLDAIRSGELPFSCGIDAQAEAALLHAGNADSAPGNLVIALNRGADGMTLSCRSG